MADLEAAVYSHLIAQAGITALVSQRIYPDAIPQNVVRPYITYTVVSARRPHNFAAASGMADYRIQFDIYAATSEETRAIAEALRNELDGLSGTLGSVIVSLARFANEQRLSVSPSSGAELALSRRIVDYLIWHRESLPTL